MEVCPFWINSFCPVKCPSGKCHKTTWSLVKTKRKDLVDRKPTFVQVRAWCRQATSHYLNKCLPMFMSPYGVTGPHWFNWSECSTNITVLLSHITVECDSVISRRSSWKYLQYIYIHSSPAGRWNWGCHLCVQIRTYVTALSLLCHM